jgi:signal transduction histidine kinase
MHRNRCHGVSSSTDSGMMDAGDGHVAGAVTVDSVPYPVVGYTFSDETAVIAESNPSFDTRYGTATGISIRNWVQTELDAGQRTTDRLCSMLAAQDDTDAERHDPSTPVTTGDGHYLHVLDTAACPERVEGYLLVTRQEGARVEVDRIASVVSHDLRNPLDVAKAQLRAARETGDPEHFEQLKKSHDRMEQIIQDVLTLARGEKAVDITEKVSIADVAADAWETVNTESAALTVEDGLPTVQADPERVQRLLENLFRNSVEHAIPESGRPDTASDGRPGDTGEPLSLCAGRLDDGFFIADNGVGIPPERRTQVFDPGYSSNGTGLGLTIVRQIVEAHGWSVSVTTGTSGGARFEFRLPSLRDEA